MSAVKPIPAAGTAVDYDPFADGALARVVPTTEPQREIWLADQLGRDASLAFNESVTMRLRGRLDAEALRDALQGLLDRHAALRANLGPEGDTLCMLDGVRLELQTFDYAALDEATRDAAVAERLRLAVDTPFALQHDRLFRAELLRLGNDDHLLVLTAHHIVCDGWSWWVLTRELAALYAQRLGTPATLPPADDFADYALAEATRHADAGFADDEAYWLSRFSGGAPVLDLPTDRPRAMRRSFASAREDYVLDAELVAAIRKMGARRGVSLFATLLASFAALLSRLASQSQVVVGIPAAGQSVDGHDHLVGHCVNTLPLLFDLDPAQPVARAVDDAQSTLLDALDHQRYTFGTLLRKLKVARDPSRLPLISVMFNIDQALDHEHAAFPGLEMEFASNARTFENFEIFVNAVQVQGQLRLECQYNRDLFDTSTIRHWLGHWRTMLEAMVEDDGQALGRVPLLAETERRLVLEKFNDTQVDYPRDRCIQGLIEDQVRRTPDAIAVEHEGASLSFDVLNKAANRLAHHLHGLGVKPDDRIAVCAERSLDMVVGLLAVLKAGAAYVPLDPKYPADRLAYMLKDSRPSVLLTQRALEGTLAAIDPSVPQLVLDAAEPGWAGQPHTDPGIADTGMAATNLAYVIYTSGSTGMPKGAMNEHRGVVNRLLWMRDEYDIDGSDVILQKTPFSFDVSVWEFFLPLLSGARLVMARAEGHRDPAYLADIVQARGVTTLHFVPSMLHAFLEHADVARACAGVRRVICSGEALPASLVEAFRQKLPGVELHNLYGPTEAAVDVTAWDCSAGVAGAAVPIGRPVANTRIYILDGFGQPVPVGVSGEIFIGGVQVGRGYLGRDELTAERFLDDPFVREPGARMYKTGDLGRWRADGAIEYLGRNDFQVKLRGFRIELGEIENNLVAHESVAQAVVIAREDRPGDVRLVAYVVARPGAKLDPAVLSAHLKTMLPEYMVPQHFVAMDAIPLSPNGKVERKALPAPDLSVHAAGDLVLPRNATERAIAEAMSQVLGVPDIGVHDDFFALGGHSLLAAQLTTRLNRDLGAALSLRSVFDRPTVARLAEVVDESAGLATPRSRIVRREDQSRAPLSLVQERLRMLEAFNPGMLSYNTPSGHRLRGPLDVALLDRAFREVAHRQTVLRTTISTEDGESVQIVHDTIDPGLLDVQDLSALPADEREAEVARRMQAMVETPFADLSQAPLFRARLFKLAEDEHALFFMPHHIIWDGWSFDLLYSDVAEIYAALLEGRAPQLPELPVTYGDYAAWHNEWIKGPEYAQQLASWRERLGAPNSQGGRPQALPTDKPRKRGMSGSSASCKVVVPSELTAALHACSRGMDVTLFVTLLSAYALLLAHSSGQRDMVIGTPVRGRNSSEVEGLMGYFTNLLPLRMEIDPAQPFAELVRKVRDVVLDSFSAPDIRLEDLTRELSLRSEGGGAMLYQALFSFQDIRQRVVRWGNLDHSRIEVFQPGATEDLGLWFVEDGGGMTGGLIYNADILLEDTVLRLRRRYLSLLHAIVADPSRTFAELVAECDRDDAQCLDDPRDIAAANESHTQEDNDMPSATAISPMVQSRERYLLDMWSQLLDTEVKPADNFFDLGGNSMLAVQMSERVARETGVRIKLMQLAVQSLAEIATGLPGEAAPGPRSPGGGLASRIMRLFGASPAGG
ncbi:amino acid adenylation domain-containing protein [Luteimonas mephitis]|uniref:amino acid adenylation domain-containing protein n=1 Tax=Luteimonas mephitis TaxID=83615 RepID=UPI003A8E03B7